MIENQVLNVVSVKFICLAKKSTTRLTQPAKFIASLLLATMVLLNGANGNNLSASTKENPFAAKSSPAETVKYIRVAGSGFFDPYGTSFPQYKTKHYKSKNTAKKKDPKPDYSLGGNTKYNNYIKSYNPKNGMDFDDPDQEYYNEYPEDRQYKRTVSTTYRTMCVRLKDGFYWPINFARNKSDLKKDALKCEQSCSDKVRFFYYPSTSDNVEDMRDLKGKSYTSLKTAFLYRTKYVKDANCKPKPWSQEAKATHAKYALLDSDKKRRMHIALTKRAEKKRVATLLAAADRLLNKRGNKGRYYKKRKARYGRKVARAYRRKSYKTSFNY